MTPLWRHGSNHSAKGGRREPSRVCAKQGRAHPATSFNQWQEPHVKNPKTSDALAWAMIAAVFLFIGALIAPSPTSGSSLLASALNVSKPYRTL
jgi:hypothetical protein